MTTARDFSVMPVLVVDQERVALSRAVRTKGGSTRPGDVVEVEFGAAWITIGGRQERLPGQWRECRIQRVVHSELHVELLGAQRTTQVLKACPCDGGWVCELHADRGLDTCGCGGAGTKCPDPECPWWEGPNPAAMDLQSERRKPS